MRETVRAYNVLHIKRDDRLLFETRNWIHVMYNTYGQ